MQAKRLMLGNTGSMRITEPRIATVPSIIFAASMVAFAHSAYSKPSQAQLIIPGRRIGSLELRSYPAGQLPPGKPDASDAGMSHYHYLWVSHRREGRRVLTYTTIAAAVANAPVNGKPGVTIEAIRVTLPVFRTPAGVAVGSRLADARFRYRHLRPDPNLPNILVDQNGGIAFEFASGHPRPASRCIAVMVFRPGNPQVYGSKQAADFMNEVRIAH